MKWTPFLNFKVWGHWCATFLSQRDCLVSKRNTLKTFINLAQRESKNLGWVWLVINLLMERLLLYFKLLLEKW